MEGHRVRRQRSSTTKTKQPEPLERIQPNAAGIDCGSRHHHVAVPVGCFRHQLLLPRPYLVLTKPLRLDIQCQRGASVKIGWKYLDD